MPKKPKKSVKVVESEEESDIEYDDESEADHGQLEGYE